MKTKISILFLCGVIFTGTVWAAGLSGARQPVQMLGDSMMEVPGQQLVREFAKRGIQADTFSRIGSGLVRSDSFDWMDKIDELSKQNPKVAVVALGANDQQALQIAGGSIQPGTPEWREEYSRRIGQMMDKLIGSGCEHVIWFMLPTMKDASKDKFAKEVNEMVIAEAKTRRQVITYDFNKLITRGGKYTEGIMVRQPTPHSVNVRSSDGIHLTGDGAKIVATDLLNTYWP